MFEESDVSFGEDLSSSFMDVDSATELPNAGFVARGSADANLLENESDEGEDDEGEYDEDENDEDEYDEDEYDEVEYDEVEDDEVKIEDVFECENAVDQIGDSPVDIYSLENPNPHASPQTVQGPMDGTYIVRNENSETTIHPRMKDYIERMRFAQILLGPVNVPEKTSHHVRMQGRMTPPQKHLLRYVNTVLQYQPAVQRLAHVAAKSRNTFSNHIKRYVLFMAEKGYTPDNFVVCGEKMVDCMKQYEQEHKTERGMVVPPTHKFILNFQIGLRALQICLGIYHTRTIKNGDERTLRQQKKWGKIPHYDLMMQYVNEAKTRRYFVAKDKIHDEPLPEMDKTEYSDEQLKEMMVAMYNKTGSPKKEVIYDSLNTILGFLIGHHLVLRSPIKCKLELSDSSYTKKDTAHGNVPVLSFKFLKGKTSDANKPPQQTEVCRNKDVEVCLVSAYAMSLWYRFDFKDRHGPLTEDRAPDFMNKLNWYPLKVLWSKSPDSMIGMNAISRNYEASLVRRCLKVVGLHSSANSHLGEFGSTQKADAMRIEEYQLRRAGQWRPEAYQNSHLGPYASEFLHRTGGFEPTEKYFLPREIEPPEELKLKIFPWLEETKAKLKEHGDQANVNIADRDCLSLAFLQMLVDFRSVILQDLALMKDIASGSIFSQHEITRDPLFVGFKARVDERNRNASLAASIADRPSVNDVVGLGFTRELEIMNAGCDKMMSECSSKLGSLEQDFEKAEASSVAKEASHMRHASAITRELLGSTSKEKLKKIGMQFDDIREANSRTNRNISLISDRLSTGIIQPISSLSASSSNPSFAMATQSASIVEASTVSTAQSEKDERDRLNALKTTRLRREVFAGWQLSKQTATIPQLVEEWYNPKGSIPSVEERNARAGSKWRGSPSFYKRRKAIIDFIESVTRDEEFEGITRAKTARVLQGLMVSLNLRINGLATWLLSISESPGKPSGRRLIKEAFKARWDAELE